MPKRNTEEYENDDGFVEDAPKSRSTGSSKKRKQFSPGTELSGSRPIPGGGQASDDGEFWELSGKRRIQISKFNGKQMINIREYYEKDGQFLPGKKGIALTLEQFDTVITLLPHVETVLKQKGHVPKRPQYGTSAGAGSDGDEDEDEEAIKYEANADDSKGQDEMKTSKDKSTRKKAAAGDASRKKNFDDTSEDD